MIIEYKLMITICSLKRRTVKTILAALCIYINVYFYVK